MVEGDRMTIKKLGVLGDVHAEDETLLAALEFFAAVGVDRVVCVGDVIDGAGDAERCIAALRSREIATVRGNHERWFTESRRMLLSDATPEESLSEGSVAWLRRLPAMQTIPTVSGDALLCHSLGRNDLSRLRPDDPIDPDCPSWALQGLLDDAAGCRFVVNGHTHLPMVREVGHVVVLNAGTLSSSYDPVVMLVDFEQLEVAWYPCAASFVATTPVRRERVPHLRGR
jgi:predicted phosphodiesterase